MGAAAASRQPVTVPTHAARQEPALLERRVRPLGRRADARAELRKLAPLLHGQADRPRVGLVVDRARHGGLLARCAAAVRGRASVVVVVALVPARVVGARVVGVLVLAAPGRVSGGGVALRSHPRGSCPGTGPPTNRVNGTNFFRARFSERPVATDDAVVNARGARENFSVRARGAREENARKTCSSRARGGAARRRPAAR